MIKLSRIAFLLLLIMPLQAIADEDALNARKNELFAKIKCPTCEGQSIKESDTLAAQTLKAFVIERLNNGDTNDSILDSIAQNYGADIITEPKPQRSTALLWGMPCMFLLYLLWRFKSHLSFRWK